MDTKRKGLWMIGIIKVGTRKGFRDVRGEGIREDAKLFNIDTGRVDFFDVYFIKGDLNQEELERIALSIVSDPVVNTVDTSPDFSDGFLISSRPGVFDSVGETIKEITRILKIPVENARSGRFIKVEKTLDDKQRNIFLNRVVMNPVVEQVIDSPDEVFIKPREYKFRLINVPIINADDERLMEISREGVLSLNLDEMRRIQEYFRGIGREPTDCELETIAQTWSEHCYHKTFKSTIIHNGKNMGTLFSYIKRATEEIDAPWTLLTFIDNAGAIAFDDKYAVTFKVETHNHPSAIEPYGGAGTGIGGVIRDTLGTGKGAKPVANTDVFCFANPEMRLEDVPSGVLHPRRIVRGVVSGVRDYGNRMGIPTVNGAVCFSDDFLHNPLVFAGSIGVIPREQLKKGIKPGYKIVLVGGKTGRDGIHGATFSSMELTEESLDVSISAVQIGNPIEEKKMLDCIIKARDMGLIQSITDCGAGGLSSAVGEMGKDTGAKVYLERVPLKYSGLSYTEIWISESQERMVIAVKEEDLERLLEVFREEDVEATVIGEFTNDKKLVLYYDGNVVCDIHMDFLHNGVPLSEREITILDRMEDVDIPEPNNMNDVLMGVIRMPDVASKEWIVRQYDHEVQGGSVLKPFMGSLPSDGAIIRPVLESERAVVISNGINPHYGKIDPYRMAASVIEEALRNLVSCGGKLENTAILDNFAFGDTDDPKILGDLFLSVKACYEYAKIYGVPYISGKDSLHNKYRMSDGFRSIPPTLLISAIGVLEDYKLAMSPEFKTLGNPVYLIGDTKKELGGSQYFLYRGIRERGIVPEVDKVLSPRVLCAVADGVRKGFFKAVHDVSQGGIGVAISEMCFHMGGEFSFETDMRPDYFLFSESNTRFIVEVDMEKENEFLESFKGIYLQRIGVVGGNGRLIIDVNGERVIDLDIDHVYTAFSGGIKW